MTLVFDTLGHLNAGKSLKNLFFFLTLFIITCPNTVQKRQLGKEEDHKQFLQDKEKMQWN